MNWPLYDFLDLSRRSRGGERLFYVYAHRRRSDGEIFYIGKGTRHRAMESASRCAHWHNIVKKYGGFDVEVVGVFDSEQEAFDHERFAIFCLRAFGARLANKTSGGDGVSGLRHTEESKALMSSRQKGKRLSDETRRKMSESRRGKKVPAISIACKGRVVSAEGRKNMSMARRAMDPATKKRLAESLRAKHSVAIRCIELGVVFPSIRAAVKWLREGEHKKAQPSSICECCKNRQQTAYGFKWEYANNQPKERST